MPVYQPNQYQYYPAPSFPNGYTLLSNIMGYRFAKGDEYDQVAHESTANMKAFAKSQLPNKADTAGELDELFRFFPGLKAKGNRTARRQLSEQARDIIAKVSAENARSVEVIGLTERAFYTVMKRGDPDAEGSTVLADNEKIKNTILNGTAADRGKLVEEQIYEAMKYFNLIATRNFTDEFIVKNFEELYNAQSLIANSAAFLSLTKETANPTYRIEISDEAKEILQMMELHSTKCDAPLQRARAIANANYELVDHNYLFTASNAEFENLKQYLGGDDARVSSLNQYDLLIPIPTYRYWSSVGTAVDMADKILADFAKEPKAPMVKGLDPYDNPYNIQCSRKSAFTDLAGNLNGYAIAYTDQKAVCYHMEPSGNITQVNAKDMLNDMPGEIDAALKALQHANKGLFIGSKEFSNGLKAMTEISKSMHGKQFPVVGDEFMKTQLNATIALCQEYLNKKNPQELEFRDIEFNNAREQHRYLAMQQAMMTCQRQLKVLALQEEALSIETAVAANQMRSQPNQWKYSVPNTKDMTADQFFDYVKSVHEQAGTHSFVDAMSSKDCTPATYYNSVTKSLETKVATDIYLRAVGAKGEERTQLLEAYKKNYTAIAVGLGEYVVNHTNKDILAAHCSHPEEVSSEYFALSQASDEIIRTGVEGYLNQLKEFNNANASSAPLNNEPQNEGLQQENPAIQVPQQNGLHH